MALEGVRPSVSTPAASPCLLLTLSSRMLKHGNQITKIRKPPRRSVFTLNYGNRIKLRAVGNGRSRGLDVVWRTCSRDSFRRESSMMKNSKADPNEGRQGKNGRIIRDG
jgi:hypothetical protein